jgi:hypothetical protein
MGGIVARIIRGHLRSPRGREKADPAGAQAVLALSLLKAGLR